jgi:hypothetical protein
MPDQLDVSATVAVHGLLLLPHAGHAQLERELQWIGLHGELAAGSACRPSPSYAEALQQLSPLSLSMKIDVPLPARPMSKSFRTQDEPSKKMKSAFSCSHWSSRRRAHVDAP